MTNYLAIFLSGIASMVIGSIWYGPLFGKPFMKATGLDSLSPEKKEAEKKKMAMLYFGQFVSSLVMFFVLSGLIKWTAPAVNASYGMGIAFFMWLGFVVPVQFGQQLWGGKMVLFWLGAGNMLLTLLAAGAIIGVMK